jgi:hypothetical protein
MKSIGLLFKVLWSPGEAMLLLSKNPRVLVPIVFLSLSSLMTGIILMTKVPAAELAMRAIERSPQGANLSDEARQRIRQQVDSPAMRSFTIVTTGLGPLVFVLIVTATYFALFTMIGREGSFKAFFSITTFAFVPTIFRQLTVVLNAFFMPPSSIMPDELGSLSPAVFLDRDAVSPVVFAGVNMIDIVSIWILFLLVIGFGFVTRKSLSKATRAGTVFGVFLVYAFFRLLLASVRRF